MTELKKEGVWILDFASKPTVLSSDASSYSLGAAFLPVHVEELKSVAFPYHTLH